MLAGRANKLAVPIKTVVAAIHAARVRDRGDASVEDTTFTVAMQLFALLASEIAPEMMSMLVPTLEDPKVAGVHFRDWLAEVARAHLDSQ